MHRATDSNIFRETERGVGVSWGRGEAIDGWRHILPENLNKIVC